MASYECADCNNHTVVQANLRHKPHCIHCGSKNVSRNVGMKNTREGARLVASLQNKNQDLARLDCPKCGTHSIVHPQTAGRLATGADEATMHCASCGTEMKFSIKALFDKETSPLAEDENMGVDEELEQLPMLGEDDLEASEDEDDTMEQEDLKDDMELEEESTVTRKAKHSQFIKSFVDRLEDKDKPTAKRVDADFEDELEDEDEIDEVIEDLEFEEGDDLGGQDDAFVLDEAETAKGKSKDKQASAGVMQVPVYRCLEQEFDPANLQFVEVGERILAMVGDNCVATKPVESEHDFTKTSSAVSNAIKGGATLAKAFKLGDLTPTQVSVAYDAAVESELEAKLGATQDSIDAELSKINQTLEQALGIAACGINRGWFTGGNGSPLVSAVASAVHAATDLSQDEAASMVAAVFDECGDDYVELVRTKAMELIDTSEEVRNELATNIMAQAHVGGVKPAHGNSTAVATRLLNPMRTTKGFADNYAGNGNGSKTTAASNGAERIRELASQSALFQSP